MNLENEAVLLIACMLRLQPLANGQFRPMDRAGKHTCFNPLASYGDALAVAAEMCMTVAFDREGVHVTHESGVTSRVQLTDREALGCKRTGACHAITSVAYRVARRMHEKVLFGTEPLPRAHSVTKLSVDNVWHLDFSSAPSYLLAVHPERDPDTDNLLALIMVVRNAEGVTHFRIDVHKWTVVDTVAHWFDIRRMLASGNALQAIQSPKGFPVSDFVEGFQWNRILQITLSTGTFSFYCTRPS